MASSSSKVVVYAAIAANVAVAVTKFVAAYYTGSSAMLSEGLHSVVDVGANILLLLGTRRARRPADETHPFGHGQELYFWTLVVAVMIFAVGGGMSVYEGITHILNPHELENAMWNYVVLATAFVFNGVSWVVAMKEFRAATRGEPFWRAVRTSKDPTVFTVIFEDTADLVGLAIAFVGVYLGHVLRNPYVDGVASIGIGLLLAGVATFLAWESRGLLIGERADPRLIAGVNSLLRADPAVEHAAPPLSVHFGPDSVMLALELQFRPSLSARDTVQAIERIEHRIRESYPVVRHVFIESRALAGDAAP